MPSITTAREEYTISPDEETIIRQDVNSQYNLSVDYLKIAVLLRNKTKYTVRDSISWYRVSLGLVCLYILEKVEIWSGVTDA